MEGGKINQKVKIYVVGSGLEPQLGGKGFNSKQEYNNSLVEELSDKFEKIEIYSCDINQKPGKEKEKVSNNIEITRKQIKQKDANKIQFKEEISPKKDNEFLIVVDGVGYEADKDNRKYLKNIDDFIKEINKDGVRSMYVNWCAGECCNKMPIISTSPYEISQDPLKYLIISNKESGRHKDFSKELSSEISNLINTPVQERKQKLEKLDYKIENPQLEGRQTMANIAAEFIRGQKNPMLNTFASKIENGIATEMDLKLANMVFLKLGMKNGFSDVMSNIQSQADKELPKEVFDFIGFNLKKDQEKKEVKAKSPEKNLTTKEEGKSPTK